MRREEEQADRVVEEFAARRKRQWLISGVAVVACLGMFLAERVPQYALVANVSLVVVILGALIFSLANWRCPACGSSLGKTINPSYCQRCGAKLR